MGSRKRNIVIAIMVSMFLAAFEGTVVTTAMPTIAGELKGFELISWVFSAYLLTSAITTPIYGKLSDLYGRKNILSVGIIIFLIGSTLCGISSSMYMLIAFRALQGVGAGAILTVTYTILGDSFDLSERAKVQGWLSTVWGIASLIGPFIGGFLIDYLSWKWIFFINIPFGILSIVLLQRNLKESIERKKHKIDYLGSTILTGAILSLLIAVILNGESSQQNSKLVGSLFIFTAMLMGVFYVVEKKAEEPIVPFNIFTKSFTVINIIAFLTSGVLIGVEGYMPIYIQSVLGFGATISGLTMAPMSVAWLSSAFILSKAIPKYGEKKIMITSNIIIIVCSFLLFTLKVDSSLALLILFVTIMGLGFGSAFTIFTVVVQASVGYSLRGAATAVNTLLRTLGQTIAVTVLGTVLNTNIIKYFKSSGVTITDTNNLYSAENLAKGITEMQIKSALHSGVHGIFLILILISLACLVLAFMLPVNLKGQEAAANESNSYESIGA